MKTNSRRPIGRALMAALSAATLLVAGCASLPSGQLPTEAALQTIKPGMTRTQVETQFGRPFWVFGVWQEHMTILNYRFNRNECVIWQVSIRTDGTVKDTSYGNDPACEAPNDKS
ncbi:MAG: hypothetical protein JWQ11_4245 [Rhizobacter sp.]|nr:hypothetical protein [Rhizobacter sp.]